MSDEELLQEWRAARGRDASPVSRADEKLILTALRSRQESIDHPQPLQFCSACHAKARGLHRPR
jgi:hypothetical protein